MQQTALETDAILTLSAFTQIKLVNATRMLHTILLLTLIRTTPGSGCRWPYTYPYPYPTYYFSYKKVQRRRLIASGQVEMNKL